MLEHLFDRHLEEDEELYWVVHKHWILLLPHLAGPVMALLATWIFLYFVPFILVTIAVILLDAAIATSWLLRNFLDYYLDAWLITDRAVIDVAWHGWFHRQSTRVDYSSIEGVSYEIQGVLGTLFHFGTVTIEKVGTGSTVSVESVGHPRDVESAILACQEAFLRTKNLKDSETVKDIIAEIVAERMHLKEIGGNEKEEEFKEVSK